MWSISAAFLLLSYGFVQALPNASNNSATSKGGLKWAPCDLDFPQSLQDAITVPIDCATLKVPLDYTKPKDGRTLDLQLIKVNATQGPRKGSIIFNPGGPGSSGVEEVAQQGPLYVETLGGQYDIIGFDARGTGHTIPYTCNLPETKSNTTARRGTPVTTLPQEDVWNLLESKAWHDGGIVASACYETFKSTGHLYGTAFVARDMLQIVDALNEDGMLRFWGRSYSTVLGQTFAAMFPDRVGRMLLDSVLLADDYFSGTWQTAIRQADNSLNNFFTECIAAGPEKCPFANQTGPDTTPQDLTAALGEVFQELIDEPIILPDNFPLRYWWQPGGLNLLNQLKFNIFNGLFNPTSSTILMIQIYLAFSRDWTGYTNPTDQADTPSWNLQKHAFHGIGCSDTVFRVKSPQEMYSLIQTQSQQGTFADAFTPQVWACAQWKMDAAERYEGSWGNISTGFPILLANSPYDPITPLSSAYEVSAGLKNSRVVVHEGHGHGVMNHRSECTIKAIREYFVDGTLPEHGTKCKPDQTAFDAGGVEAGWWESLLQSV